MLSAVIIQIKNINLIQKGFRNFECGVCIHYLSAFAANVSQEFRTGQLMQTIFTANL